jgi:protein SCO1
MSRSRGRSVVIPVCDQTCHSEERSDEESGWGKAQINQSPPRSLAEPALSGVEGLGMTPLLDDRWQTGMRGIRSRVVCALVVAAAVTAGAAAPARAQRNEPLPKQLEGVGITEKPGAQVPLDLEFTAEDGKPVRLSQYISGKKPVILTLNYYRCPMLCTLLLNGLMDGLKALQWTPGQEFEVVTVSIDPLETPKLAMLKKESYISEFGRPAAAAGWHFLTGSERNIKTLTASVGFGYRYDEERQQYAHAAGIFLLTPDGRVARVLYGVMFEPRTLKLALTEAGEGKVGSTADQALLYCYHYDANAGRYVVAASNIMRLGGATTAVIVGVWLLSAWRRSARTGAGVRPETHGPAV